MHTSESKKKYIVSFMMQKQKITNKLVMLLLLARQSKLCKVLRPMCEFIIL